jgi:hypothetical protein
VVGEELGAFVILLGDTVGVPAKSTLKSVVGAIVGTGVGILTGMPVGLRDGDATATFDSSSKGEGAGVATTSGVGVLLLGEAPGLVVGPRVDSPAGDIVKPSFGIVGRLFGASVGLRVGDDTGTFDTLSIGVLVWDSPLVDGGRVGRLVTLAFGDATGKLVGMPIGNPSGELVGEPGNTSMGLPD